MVHNFEDGLGQEGLRLWRVGGSKENIAKSSTKSIHIEQRMLVELLFQIFLMQVLMPCWDGKVLHIVHGGRQH